MLEDRRLMATINVTSAADDGSANTLRWAIGMANTADSPTSINIELGTAPAAISLALGQLELSNTAQPVTIYDGVGQGPVSISGNNESTGVRYRCECHGNALGPDDHGRFHARKWRRDVQRGYAHAIGLHN